MITVTTVRELSRGTYKSGKQAGQPWVMWLAGLSDGREASGFDKAEIGDAVEVKQKGEYLNYKLSAGVHSNGGNGANGSPALTAGSASPPAADSRDASIKWLACLKVAGLLFAGTKELSQCMDAARFIYNEPIVTIDVVEDAKKLFNATEAKEPF